MQRILGDLNRLTFDTWLERVQQVIQSIEPEYTWLVAAMRDRVVSMIEFQEEELNQRKIPQIQLREDRSPKQGRWTRITTPQKPSSIVPIKGAFKWQSPDEYPDLECSIGGEIRMKQTKKEFPVHVYEGKPYILFQRKKIRADKLVWQAFANDEKNWSQLRVYPQNGDPANISLENLQDKPPKKERKPRKKRTILGRRLSSDEDQED